MITSNTKTTPNQQFPWKIIDLTHKISKDTPSWDGGCGFNLKIVWDYDAVYETPGDNVGGDGGKEKDDNIITKDDEPPVFRINQIEHMPAGFGTHMDSPAHCYKGGRTIDQISLQKDCIAPCVVIDVSKIANLEDFLLTNNDIENFEKEHGRISEGSFVIVRTGWDKYWDQPLLYRNDLQFPSISKEAALTFVDRNVIGIGIDTLSPDVGNSTYQVHKIILGAGKYIVENIANASELPPVGAFTLAVPVPFVGATESTTRLIGLIN
eukprot:gene2846-3537_t